MTTIDIRVGAGNGKVAKHYKKISKTYENRCNIVAEMRIIDSKKLNSGAFGNNIY